jgi:hypothetical protein
MIKKYQINPNKRTLTFLLAILFANGELPLYANTIQKNRTNEKSSKSKNRITREIQQVPTEEEVPMFGGFKSIDNSWTNTNMMQVYGGGLDVALSYAIWKKYKRTARALELHLSDVPEVAEFKRACDAVERTTLALETPEGRNAILNQINGPGGEIETFNGLTAESSSRKSKDQVPKEFTRSIISKLQGISLSLQSAERMSQNDLDTQHQTSLKKLDDTVKALDTITDPETRFLAQKFAREKLAENTGLLSQDLEALKEKRVELLKQANKNRFVKVALADELELQKSIGELERAIVSGKAHQKANPGQRAPHWDSSQNALISHVNALERAKTSTLEKIPKDKRESVARAAYEGNFKQLKSTARKWKTAGILMILYSVRSLSLRLFWYTDFDDDKFFGIEEKVSVPGWFPVVPWGYYHVSHKDGIAASLMSLVTSPDGTVDEEQKRELEKQFEELQKTAEEKK